MSMQRLKSIIYEQIVPEGWGMSFEEPSVAVLEELIEIATNAKAELLNAQNEIAEVNATKLHLTHWLLLLDSLIDGPATWERKYDECWLIKDEMFKLTTFDWYDPDCDYEDDVRAFYRAAKDHIEGL